MENNITKNGDDFGQSLAAHKDAQISEEQQQKLNAPLKKEGGMSEESQKYLKEILELINKGEVDIGKPSSLINQDVYEKLAPEHKVKVEMIARVMISNLRQIKDLNDHPVYETNSDQMEDLLSFVKQEVANIEAIEGNVLKI